MPEKVELKPCPFCGGEVKLRRSDSSYRSHPTTILDSWGVECMNDCCTTKRFKDEIYHADSGAVVIVHNGAQEAAEAWNKRAGDSKRGWKRMADVIKLPTYNVNMGDAVVIVKRCINDESIALETKLLAIEKVASMETHNSITKDDLVKCLRWLFEHYDF